MGNGFGRLIPNANRQRDGDCSGKGLPSRVGVWGAGGDPARFWQSCAGRLQGHPCGAAPLPAEMAAHTRHHTSDKWAVAGSVETS